MLIILNIISLNKIDLKYEKYKHFIKIIKIFIALSLTAPDAGKSLEPLIGSSGWLSGQA